MGCLFTAQDKDIWPAYAYLIMGETGEHDTRNGMDLQLTSGLLTLAIVVLTFIRRFLDSNRTPIAYLSTCEQRRIRVTY